MSEPIEVETSTVEREPLPYDEEANRVQDDEATE